LRIRSDRICEGNHHFLFHPQFTYMIISYIHSHHYSTRAFCVWNYYHQLSVTWLIHYLSPHIQRALVE